VKEIAAVTLFRQPVDEVSTMAILTLSNILDDLCVAEEALHRFERRYWLSSSAFYDLYSKGFLDDGSHAEDLYLLNSSGNRSLWPVS